MAHKHRSNRSVPPETPPVSARHSLEKPPLTTGQQLPDVSPAVRAAMALKPWYATRRAAGILALVLIVILLALSAWFGRAGYEMLVNYIASWWIGNGR